MAKTVAIVNQKGGVGKTTTCVNLAAALGEQGKRVLLCDFDPQANSTSGMGVDKTISKGVYEVLIGEMPTRDALVHTKFGDVLPSNKALAGAGIELIGMDQREILLKRVLDQISAGFSDGRAYTDLTNRLLFGGGGGIADEYMLLADFDSYCQAHRRSLEVYKDRRAWDQKSLINIARSGIFAADRSIRDYARDIWHVPTRFD